ncbi:MAG TPA: FCD domain-containing protein [Nocardioides sp.]|uniref:FadR/GntR family transcriptional regulator n=1 Tax=Nocardioides sp. TaxID=35761 RepID=UPI002E334880|nr:FCD domain-containing protein [Nocardioides sp.]HEX3931593.1 FCD domain-containing protein [Nocardioides sp.]
MTGSSSAQQLPDLARVVLRPVRGHHAFEACVEQLATAIRLGVHPHGTTLPPERELAQRLHVSRATVREAIIALRTAGMVETRRGRGGGSVVTYSPRRPRARARAAKSPSAEILASWLDSLTFRRIVEPGAVATAAGLDLADDQRAMLTTAYDAVTRAAGSAAHRQADSRFHLAFASVTGSPSIIEAVTRVQAALHDMLMQIPVYDVNIGHSNSQHEGILQAVLDGRVERARQTMEEHCDDTAALLRGLLG